MWLKKFPIDPGYVPLMRHIKGTEVRDFLSPNLFSDLLYMGPRWRRHRKVGITAIRDTQHYSNSEYENLSIVTFLVIVIRSLNV